MESLKTKLLRFLTANKNHSIPLYKVETKGNVYGLVTVLYESQKYYYLINPKSIPLTIEGIDEDGNHHHLNIKSTVIIPWLKDIQIYRNDLVLQDNQHSIKKTFVETVEETIDLDKYLEKYDQYLLDFENPYMFKYPLPEKFFDGFYLDTSKPGRLYLENNSGSYPQRRCFFDSIYNKEDHCIYTFSVCAIERGLNQVVKNKLQATQYDKQYFQSVNNKLDQIDKQQFKQAFDRFLSVIEHLETFAQALS